MTQCCACIAIAKPANKLASAIEALASRELISSSNIANDGIDRFKDRIAYSIEIEDAFLFQIDSAAWLIASRPVDTVYSIGRVKTNCGSTKVYVAKANYLREKVFSLLYYPNKWQKG